MKGIVFNLFADVVTSEFGEDHFDDLLDSAGADGSYTSLGNYHDLELISMVGAHAEATGQSVPDVLLWFGRSSMPHLAERYAVLFTSQPDTRAFLMTINSTIHAEVRKLYPGATPPHFDLDTSDPDVLIMTYHSGRSLCPLARGFIAGAADHYGEVPQVTETACKSDGADACRMEVRFLR